MRQQPERIYRNDSQFTRICIWGVDHSSSRTARAIRDQLGENLQKLRVVSQKNGRKRIDIYVNERLAETTITGLRQNRRWRARRDTPKQLRNPRHNSKPKNLNGIKLITLNIFGIKEKKLDFQLFLDKHQPDILALQETKLAQSSFGLRLYGYSSIDAPVILGAKHSHGLVLACRNASGLSMTNLGKPTPFQAFGLLKGRITDGAGMMTIVAASVYIPKSREREGVVRNLAESTHHYMTRYPEAVVVWMGDFNCKKERLAKWMWENGLEGEIADIDGPTFARNPRTTSQIDFIVTFRAMSERGRVHRSWDISDHWPVEATLPLSANVTRQQPPREILKRKKIGPNAEAIVNDNRFAVLAKLDEDIDQLAEKFTMVSAEIAKEKRVIGPTSQVRHPEIPGKFRRSVKKRRKAYRAAFKDPSPEKLIDYAEAKAEAEALKREVYRERNAKHVRKVAHLIQRRDMKGCWAWIRSSARYKAMKRASSSIINPTTGQPCKDPLDTAEVWARHFRKLAADQTGHSRDEAYWMERFEVGEDEWIDETEDRLEWPEIANVIGLMANGKAPGIDGLPAEWLKLALQGPNSRESPSNAFARALWKILDLIWREERVPASWNPAVMVPVPKKDDLQLVDNYRGIALIPVALKIISTIVARRLQAWAEREGKLDKGQVGFRSREEAPGQVAALYEVSKRRLIGAQRTMMVFVDFSKAYDTVPQGAVLAKLKKMGTAQKLVDLVRALYRNPSLSVRLPDGSLSQAVPVECGVRQGCPSSPILFNIFINDVIAALEEEDGGVVVPGLEREGRMSGLLFADDLVVLAENEEMMMRMMARLDSWCEMNEMKVNAKKCGALEIGRNEPGWTVELGGLEVPKLSEYLYLGCLFTHDLSLDAMARNRRDVGERTLKLIEPFLLDNRIPWPVRRKMVTSVLIPQMSYGAEVWGMNALRCNPAQLILNRATRMLIGVGGKGAGVSLVALRNELMIKPMMAVAASSRARALIKYSSLKTWIGAIARSAWRSRQRTWLTNGRQWIHTNLGRNFDWASARSSDPSGRSMHQRVSRVISMEELERDGTQTVAWRRDLRLTDSDKEALATACIRYHRFSRGFSRLSKMRCRAFRFAPWLARVGYIQREFTERCPSCDCSVPEDSTHVLLECPAFDKQRRKWLEKTEV